MYYKNFYSTICLITTLITVGLLSSCGTDEALVERQKQVIKVGDMAITVRDFKDRLKEIIPKDTENATEEEITALKINLVNRLIEEAVVMKEAQRLRVNITEAHVDEELMNLKKEFGEETFKSIISTRFGNVDKWKAQIKQELTIKEAINRAITSRVTISTAGALQYYQENQKIYKMPSQVRARMIVVKKKALAKSILKKLKKGEDFAQLAKKYSTGPEAENGGDLGFFSKGDMPEEFEDATLKLKLNQLSKIIETVYGFHIFKLIDKQKRKELKFDDVEESIKEELKRKIIDREYHKWIIGLKKRLRIIIDQELILTL